MTPFAWRFYASFTASVLHTPINVLLAMDWREFLRWFEQAVEIRKMNGGR
jgi:hypothetical protein